MHDAIHLNPVWRDRANFIIAAEFTMEPTDVKTEQLWARRVGVDVFEICCIPFFLYDVALGDIVETDGDWLVRDVVKPSGRYVFRVWFGDTFYPRDEVAVGLEDLGALLEWSSPDLLAVDAVDEEHAKVLSGFLLDRQDRDELIYETGKLI